MNPPIPYLQNGKTPNEKVIPVRRNRLYDITRVLVCKGDKYISGEMQFFSILFGHCISSLGENIESLPLFFQKEKKDQDVSGSLFVTHQTVGTDTNFSLN